MLDLGHEWAREIIENTKELMEVFGGSWEKALESVLEIEYAFAHPSLPISDDFNVFAIVLVPEEKRIDD